MVVTSKGSSPQNARNKSDLGIIVIQLFVQITSRNVHHVEAPAFTDTSTTCLLPKKECGMQSMHAIHHRHLPMDPFGNL